MTSGEIEGVFLKVFKEIKQLVKGQLDNVQGTVKVCSVL